MMPKVGKVIVGHVVELRPNGAVVSWGEGTEFLHISEISEEPIKV